MTVTKTLEGKKLTVSIDGRLDTLSSPQLEKALEPGLEGLQSLIFDMTGLLYISSAGFRVLMNALQAMEAQNGEMAVVNVSESMREIFNISGLTDVLGVEFAKSGAVSRKDDP